MYDRPSRLTYHYPAVDMGAGTVTRKIRVPRGATSARVADIHAFSTETFTQVTTPGYINVGVSGDLDSLASMSMGALAANAAQCFADVNGYVADWNAEVDDVAELVVTFVAPTGGTPAGIANVDLTIDWGYMRTGPAS